MIYNARENTVQTKICAKDPRTRTRHEIVVLYFVQKTKIVHCANVH